MKRGESGKLAELNTNWIVSDTSTFDFSYTSKQEKKEGSAKELIQAAKE